MNAIAKDIYEAAVYGDVGVVKRLLKSATFADLIYKNPNDLHKTAVMVAAYHGHTEIVRAIFKHSIASVHMQDEGGWTALMFAAYSGHTSTINAILLHPEVDVNVKNNHGWTALMLAASQGHASSVRALLTRADIDVNVQNNQDGGTALLLACVLGHTEIVRDILSLKGVLVNLADKEGRIAVFAAKNDEITALINFYDPVLGLVYPLPDLPRPPSHIVAVMPPLPPVHEPKLALAAEYLQCYDEVHALLPLLPYIYIRGAWHLQRVALQHQMEAAVHIHHHKEAALIGREFLAFKATTASTAPLRALSEQDYLHLPEKVTLLQQRLTALCADLTHAEDYDTLRKAEDLVQGLNTVQRALTESATSPAIIKSHPSSPHSPHSFPPPPPPTNADGSVRDNVSDSAIHHISADVSPDPSLAKVHFADTAIAVDSVLDVTGSGGVSGAGHTVALLEENEQECLEGGDVCVSPPPPPPPLHNTPAQTPAFVGKKPTFVSVAAGVDVLSPDAVVVDSVPSSVADVTLANTHDNAASIVASPQHSHTVTESVSADPELHYLPHYTAFTNTVPSGAFELHTVKKSFEDLMADRNSDVDVQGLPPPPPPPSSKP